MEALVREFEAEHDLTPGMTIDQAKAMISDGVDQIAQRMAADGSATRAPWGIAYDLPALERSLTTALLMMRQGAQGIDDRGDAEDLSEREAGAILLQAIGGAVTAAATAILWLTSQPIPYEMARHMTTRETPAE